MVGKKELGQFFTVSKKLQSKVEEFILNYPKVILEPSVGKGHLVDFVSNKRKDVIFDCYEIDESIQLIESICSHNIFFKDFLKENIKIKYQTIIGNPPYVKHKHGNLYLDFTKKCFGLLEENGELVFIVPSDFFQLTGARHIINNMMKVGRFTHIYHPHDENLFEEASIDILIFRYCKSIKDNQLLYNDEIKYVINHNGILSFTKNIQEPDGFFIKDLFHVYVGMVSGKEDIFKNSNYGNLKVLTSENKREEYIYITKFPSENKDIDSYLLENKHILIKRKIKKMTNENWFEWGAPRNVSKMELFKGQKCIYMYNLTRKKNIAFEGQVEYFGGNLLIMIPKNGNENIKTTLQYLNTEEFRDRFNFSGRFKMTQSILSNMYIPYIR